LLFKPKRKEEKRVKLMTVCKKYSGENKRGNGDSKFWIYVDYDFK
jgi:hypothetical protein